MTWQTEVLSRLETLSKIPAGDHDRINRIVSGKIDLIHGFLAEQGTYNAFLDDDNNTILHLAAQLPNKSVAYNLTNKLLETGEYILNQPNRVGLTAEAIIKANFPITYETLANYVPKHTYEKCQWQNLIAVYQQLHIRGGTISDTEAHCLAVMSFFSKVEDFVYWVEHFPQIATLRFPALPQGLNYPSEVREGNMLIHTIAYLKNAYLKEDGKWQDRRIEDIKKMILTLQEAGCDINTLSLDRFTATHIAATNIDIHPERRDVGGKSYASHDFFSYAFKAFAEVRGNLKDDVATLYELCNAFSDFYENDYYSDGRFTLRHHIEIMLRFGGNLNSPIDGTTPRHALDEAEHFNDADYSVQDKDYLVGYNCGAAGVLNRFDKILEEKGIEGLLQVMNARKPSPAFGVGIAAGAAAGAAPGIAAGAAAGAAAVSSTPLFLSLTPLDDQPAASAAPSSSLPPLHLLGGAAAGVPAAAITPGQSLTPGQSFTSRVIDDRQGRGFKRGRGE